jgi:sulfate transport system ATP-binding protein
VAGVAARHRGIGFVFQHYALFRHMTVFDNVAFGLNVRARAARPRGSEIAARVRRLLELVQIPDLERRYPDQISGGQRQRVALARALATEPPLLLLDEPFGALDAQVRKDLRLWLRALHERLGITSLFVTHDQDEAMEIADRIAVMRAGRVVQFDTPGALLDRPADAFVAGFLGETNRLPCTVAGGLARFENLALPPLPTGAPDGPALAFVRPCDLVVEPAAPGDPAADCTVHAARHDGRTVHLLVSARGVILDGAPAAGWPSPRRGDPCKLSLRGARIFPSDDDATRAALAQREPAPSDTGLSLSGRGMHGEVGEAGA